MKLLGVVWRRQLLCGRLNWRRWILRVGMHSGM